ncbi:cbb3-type cytochrome c oxidase subunit 3 [Sandarakinorhabdus sp.]|uniref:cbb3-type cytochrome c oxidase subunit 3 n=1 Tax=Sandarakinorhabdus sp. TaxID=1916663 RepID=UPI00286EA36A|nr:cbb3-type cytochrome c oxidase subunit 3 [Sandarakinorhabdus sp.]
MSDPVSYDALRHIADSWGLLAMVVLFATFVGWTFRKGSRQRLDDAANMIFRDGADEKAD